MKKGIMIVGIAALALTFSIQANAQLEGETGLMGWYLTNAGRLYLYTPDNAGTEQISRVNIVAALSEQAVCDYNDDQDAVEDAVEIAGSIIADVEHLAYYDNSWSEAPPDLAFKLHVYGWLNTTYCIMKYTVFNVSSETYILYLGIFILPHPEDEWDQNKLEYNPAYKSAYAYLVDDTHPHSGIRILSPDPYSYKTLDWNVYSSDPGSDAATDVTRYHMTADPGFDASLTGGADGIVGSLNAGQFTLAAGDSVDLYYAMVYGDNLAAFQAASGAAAAKYTAVFGTAVDQPEAGSIPEAFGLGQNYPNPFNPATTIPFDLKAASNVTMVVYDLRGNVVTTLVNGPYAAGTHRAEWNGRDASGNVVPSGVYVCRLNAGDMTFSRKIMLVQ